MFNTMSEIVRRRLNQEKNPEYRETILDLLSLLQPKFEELARTEPGIHHYSS